MRKAVLRIMVVAAALWAGAGIVYGQSIDVQRQRKEKLEKEIAIIDRQLAENAAQSRDALSELTLIRKKIDNRKELLAQTEMEIKTLGVKISRTQGQIDKYQAQIDTLSAYYARLVKSAYKNRDAKIWYMYILASEDLGQAFRRYSYFRNLSSEMKDQARKIRNTQKELEAEKERLGKLKKEAEVLRVQRKKELIVLAGEEKQANAAIASLKKNRSRYEKSLAEKKQQVDALNREIKRLVAEALKASQKGGGTGAKRPVDTRLSAAFAASKGKLPWPAEGPVVDRFGQHNHPVYTKLKMPFNNGVNIALSRNTRVKAIFEGVVRQVQTMPGYNQCVLVQHGNYFSFYCKLKSVAVKIGETVVEGDVIGTVDTIGGETQLHFEIWKDQSPQDPQLWLKK